MKYRSFGIGLTFFVSVFLTSSMWAQQDPHYPQFMDMGNRAYNNEKYDLARDYYQSALDDNSDCWQAYVGLGNCDYAKGKLKDALKNYEKALKMNPDNPNLSRFLEALRRKMGIFPTPTPLPTPTPAPGLSSRVLPGLPLPPPGTPLPLPK